MTKISELLNQWRKTPRGPTPKIEEEEIAAALKTIEESPMGRYQLSKRLRLPEGTIRGLLDRLNQKHWIEVSKTGCSLTEEGRKTLEEYLKENGIIRLTTLNKSKIKNLAPGEEIITILIRRSEEEPNGIKQRDEAIRIGAKGATTLLVEDGTIKFPKTRESITKYYPQEDAYLREILKPKNRQIIILCWADEKSIAIKGAIKAAKTLTQK